tara:strand:+ start:126 stop:1538 length:1413 start_codon:yes stop_codon:yes gene_type:complete
MVKKFLTIILVFVFIFCSSSESDSVTESIKSIETTTSTLSTTTTTKAQDSTTQSFTSTTTSSTTTTTTLAQSTTSTTVNVENITLPKIVVTNCPSEEVTTESVELNYEISAGTYDVNYLRISYWKNEEYDGRVYFDNEMDANFPFPTAFETKQYAQTITDEDRDTLITFDVYFSISDESGTFFEIEIVCTFTFNNIPTTSTTTASSASYPQLVIREVSNSIPTYDRDDWSHWSDDDEDCQNIRHEVLQDETFEAVTFTTSSNCYVDTGKWYGVYTATYYYSASELDVDHFVPLKNAHDSGGHEWSLVKKKEYANYLEDSDHLIAVQSGANRSKGARGPENWKPENTEYWCQYAYDWIRIKDTWGLTSTQAEWDALRFMIATCPYGYSYQDAIPEPLVTVPTTTSTTTTTTVPSTTTTIPDNPGNTKNCSDFETYQEAKTWFDTYYPHYGDVAGLDGDGDEEPCESLPGGP